MKITFYENEIKEAIHRYLSNCIGKTSVSAGDIRLRNAGIGHLVVIAEIDVEEESE